MNNRQEAILKTVIKEYVNLAEPVGSKFLSQKYDWGISAATIRNDLAALVDDGYLEQPHTSAGRIPTDKGYRFFIQSLKEDISGEKRFLKIINSVFQSASEEHRLFREIARTLAELSGNMGIAGLVDPVRNYDSNGAGDYEIFKSGMSRLLRQPEFDEIDEFWRFADDFETLDRKICERAPELCETRRVRVFIGRENPLAENEELSLVISGYEKKDGRKGLTGILGPKRMKYGRNISLVDYISKLLSAS
jgi:transcriptional regulator of heat shock response